MKDWGVVFRKKKKKKKGGGKKRQEVGEWKANRKKKDIRKEADDMKLKEKLIKLATSGKGNEQ